MHSLKYILSFFAGVSLTFLLMLLVDTQPEPLNSAHDNLIDFEKAKADDTVVLKVGVVENMQQKIIELEKKLEQLVPTQLSEASDANVHNYETSIARSLAEYQASEKSLKQKLSTYSWENAMLKLRLNELEPSSVSDEEIDNLFAQPYSSLIKALPANLKENIADMHQRDEDFGWGYKMQQALSDFINTHINAQYINVVSIICKVDACEVILEEKVTAETLKNNGASGEEIEAYKKTQAPKYRAIFDELLLQPQFSLLSPAFYSPNRFSLYLLLKDTAALVAEQQPQGAS